MPLNSRSWAIIIVRQPPSPLPLHLSASCIPPRTHLRAGYKIFDQSKLRGGASPGRCVLFALAFPGGTGVLSIYSVFAIVPLAIDALGRARCAGCCGARRSCLPPRQHPCRRVLVFWINAGQSRLLVAAVSIRVSGHDHCDVKDHRESHPPLFSAQRKEVSDVYGWPGRPAQLQAPEPAESKSVPSALPHVLQRLPLLAVGGTLPSIAFLPRAYRDRGGGTDWAIEPLFWRDRWIGRRNYQ